MKRISLLLIVTVTAAVFAGQNKTPESMLGAALHQEEVQGDLKGAIAAYNKLLAGRGLSHKVAAEALYHLGLCYQKLGDTDARKAFERLVAEYGDQTAWAAQARAKLAGMGAPAQPALVRVWADMKTKGVQQISIAISPDGAFVAYPRLDGSGIWVHPLAGGEDRKITAQGSFPVISPDGRVVAYSRADGSTLELRTVNIDGSRDHVLATSAVTDNLIAYAWSPDGTRILVTRNKGASVKLGLLPVGGGGMTVLQSSERFLTARPNAFSPDGKSVVYDSGGMASGRIWLVSASAGSPIEIAGDAVGASHNWAPGWTPDGGRVLFVSNRSGSPALYSLLMAGGRPTGPPVLVDGVGLDTVAAVGRAGVQVTRDGSLFYTARTRQTDAYFARLDPASLKLTSAPQRLNQRYIGNVLGLSNWAPDGGSLLYQAQGTVVLHSTGASGEREIRSSGASLRGLRFFPDGQSVLGVSTEFENGVRRDYLRRINLQTGLVSAFDAQMPSGAWSPTWDLSPDFKFLYYSAPSEPLPAPAEGGRIPDAGGPKTVRLIRRNLLSGEEIELLRLTCNANYLANYLTDVSVSPEGNQVSFNYRDTQNPSRTWLAVAPTSGGPARQVTENRGLGETRGRTRDGKHLLFVRAGVIYTISTEGGAEQPIGGMDLMGALSDLTVNPVSGLLTFTATQTRVDLMSYKNVFPPASPR